MHGYTAERERDGGASPLILPPLYPISVFGWDHVTQGLVQLGFFLMDTFGPKPGPFGKPAESGPSGAARTPPQQACLLGRQVLLEGFKVRDSRVT